MTGYILDKHIDTAGYPYLGARGGGGGGLSSGGPCGSLGSSGLGRGGLGGRGRDLDARGEDGAPEEGRRREAQEGHARNYVDHNVARRELRRGERGRRIVMIMWVMVMMTRAIARPS
jgi:hypothetical protein